MRSAVLLFCAIGVNPVALFGAEHYVQTSIGVCWTFTCTQPGAAPAWDSGAWVESRLLGFPYVVGMRNNHNVYEDAIRLVAWRLGEGYWSDWHSYLLGGPRTSHCYNAHLDSIAGSSWRDVPSWPYRVCWYGTGDGCGECLEQDAPGDNCPLIVNLDGGPWRLTGADAPVLFDIDGNGEADRIGWTGRGSSLAFLAIDLDDDGAIRNGQELFGVGTNLPDGSKAANGFAALRLYDTNGDEVVDHRDPIWSSLLLWTDRNHDAQSQKTELVAVSESGLTGLEVESWRVGKRDINGNTFRLKSHCRIAGAKQPYYDVFFVRVE